MRRYAPRILAALKRGFVKELTLERMLQGVWFVGLGPEEQRQEDRLKTIHRIFPLDLFFIGIGFLIVSTSWLIIIAASINKS